MQTTLTYISLFAVVYNMLLCLQYSATAAGLDPDLIGGLVMEVVPESSCLVFCPTKKNCENVAQLICSILSK
jgi:POLQ-like helicase